MNFANICSSSKLASTSIVQFLGFSVFRVLITHKHGTIENYGVAKNKDNKEGQLDLHCDYKLQIVEFFACEKHLSN